MARTSASIPSRGSGAPFTLALTLSANVLWIARTAPSSVSASKMDRMCCCDHSVNEQRGDGGAQLLPVISGNEVEDNGAEGEENIEAAPDNTEVEAKPEFGKSTGEHAEEVVGIPLTVFLQASITMLSLDLFSTKLELPRLSKTKK